MTGMRTHICEGCGSTITDTPENLYKKGWDIPPYFTSHTTCPNCPITSTAWFLFKMGEALGEYEDRPSDS
jgi:hypothetical protein